MQWLRRWIERRRLRQRAIFAYHDGTRTRYADPAQIWRSLLNHPDMDLAEMGPPAEQGKEPAASTVLAALAEIFAVERWDESSKRGLTDWEILDLPHQFDEYLATLKKNISPSRMPWQLSAYGLSTGSVEPEATPKGPTSSTVDSSFSPSESSTDEATPSSEPSPMA